jgi:hypothetical protein
VEPPTDLSLLSRLKRGCIQPQADRFLGSWLLGEPEEASHRSLQGGGSQGQQRGRAALEEKVKEMHGIRSRRRSTRCSQEVFVHAATSLLYISGCKGSPRRGSSREICHLALATSNLTQSSTPHIAHAPADSTLQGNRPKGQGNTHPLQGVRRVKEDEHR